MKGYWKKPAETDEAFRGGWLHTGDVAREDKDGFMSIVDRKKDMIVTGGFNVFPREIEDVISAHPAVASGGGSRRARREVGRGRQGLRRASCRTDRGRRGTDRDGEGSQGLGARSQEHRLRGRIPVTPLGKPDKKALRARYWETSARAV